MIGSRFIGRVSDQQRMRGALELEPGFEAEYDDSDNSFTIRWPDGSYLVTWANGKIVRGKIDAALNNGAAK